MESGLVGQVQVPYNTMDREVERESVEHMAENAKAGEPPGLDTDARGCIAELARRAPV